MSGHGPVRRAAVLGHPIAHSLSPVLHRAAYRELGLDDWVYESYDRVEDQLPEFVAGLDASWAGLSLTMPLKQKIMELVDHVEPLAQVVGAVNTVLVQSAGDQLVLTGANTDVHGLVAALREGGQIPERPRALILGAGATASSSLAALAELGCTTPVVLARSIGRAGAVTRAAHRMGVEPVLRPLSEAHQALTEADVVISTLPAHSPDEWAAQFTGPVRPGAILLDVTYDPRRSVLVQAWERAGGSAVTGDRMLLHQAVEQVRLMTGQPGPLAAMDQAITAHLDAMGQLG